MEPEVDNATCNCRCGNSKNTSTKIVAIGFCWWLFEQASRVLDAKELIEVTPPVFRQSTSSGLSGRN